MPILIIFGMCLNKTSFGWVWLNAASEVGVQVGRTKAAIFWEHLLFYTHPEFGEEGGTLMEI
jgi:hypothetical protein